MLTETQLTIDAALKVFEIIAVIGGGATIIYKIGAAITKFEIIGTQQSGEITEIKLHIQQIADIITKQAIQSTRLDNLSERQTGIDKKVDAIQRELWGPNRTSSPRLKDV